MRNSGWPSLICGRVATLLRPYLDLSNLYDRIFLVLFLVDVILRVIWLDKPSGSTIFDEFYYVNVARVLLGETNQPGSIPFPVYASGTPRLDPNHEHPPLAKLLIALSMQLFGDNGYGWRIPSVIFGSVTVLVFYLLLKKLAGSHQGTPLLATFLLSFENLTFVHSRIATLDIFMLAFMVLGFYWYFSGRYYLSPIAMAFSTLSKEPGAFGFIVIIIFHFLKDVRRHSEPKFWSRALSWQAKYIITYVVSFLALLTIMDRLWVGYSSPFDHLQYIASYTQALTSHCPNGIISCPWQWMLNQVEIPYLNGKVYTRSGSYFVNFRGAMNPAELFMTIPAMLYVAYRYQKTKEPITSFVLIWFAVTYLPYFPLVIFLHRVTYIFYFLSTIPAVCAGTAYMLTDYDLPLPVVLAYVAAVMFSFGYMFPFKAIPV